MRISSSLLDKLIQTGLSGEQLIKVVEAIESEEKEQTEERRTYERERKRVQRALKNNKTCPGDSRDNAGQPGTDGTIPSPPYSPSPSSPPTPPIITPTPSTPPSGSVLADACVSEALGIWNEICGDVLPKAKPGITAREVKLRRRLAEDFHGKIEEWRAFCLTIRASPLLCGEKGDWRAGIDWVLEPRNMAKILEGNYAPRKPLKPAQEDFKAKNYMDGSDGFLV